MMTGHIHTQNDGQTEQTETTDERNERILTEKTEQTQKTVLVPYDLGESSDSELDCSIDWGEPDSRELSDSEQTRQTHGVKDEIQPHIESDDNDNDIPSDRKYDSESQKRVREKSRVCHNHKPQPFPDTKRKPTNPNKHKSNKRTKSTKISSLFPKRGNRSAKRTEKHKNKITQGKT